MEDSITYKPSKKENLIWLMLGLVVLAIGPFIIVKHQMIGWIFTGSFICAVFLFALALHPDCNYIIIDKKGILIFQYFLKQEYFWNDIENDIENLGYYEGTNVKSLKKAFKESVNDYLELCEKKSMEPDKPLKGSFNVRAGEDLHREAVVFANEHNLNLNQVIICALEKYLRLA